MTYTIISTLIDASVGYHNYIILGCSITFIQIYLLHTIYEQVKLDTLIFHFT